MNTSDTPRTNSEPKRFWENTVGNNEELVRSEFARTLERELAAAQADLVEAREELLAIKVPDFDRCEKCNTELSQCGPQGVDGEPTLDCLVCSLTERLAETRKQLAAAQAEARELREALEESQKMCIELQEELEQARN